jgi:ABC-type nickel/cobalt efflux system permease component RcnA
MQALQGLIVVLAIIRRIVVVMMPIVLIMVMAVMMVMAMMNMIFPIVRVGVHEKARERADWRRKGHAHGRRQGEHQHHRPNESDVALVCSFQSRQHAFRTRSASTTAACRF